MVLFSPYSTLIYWEECGDFETQKLSPIRVQVN